MQEGNSRCFPAVPGPHFAGSRYHGGKKHGPPLL